MKWVKDLAEAIARRIRMFAILTAAIGALFAITSDVVVLPDFTINPFLDPLRLGMMAIITILLAANATVTIPVKRFTGFAGGFPALFASSCTVCQPIWLIALGLGGTTAFLAAWSIPIMLVSIGLLVFSLNRSVHKTCGVR